MRVVVVFVLTLCLSSASLAQRTNPPVVARANAPAIPFELEANVIFLKVSVGNTRPLSFILDTGAYSIINTAHAKSLGMKLQLVGKTNSIGAEPQDVYLVSDKVSINLSGLTFSMPRLLAIPLDKVQECIDRATDYENRLRRSGSHVNTTSKRTLDGILGKEFFSSFVVEIDYQARVIRVFDPQSYHYAGDGETLPLEIRPQHIFVQTKLLTSDRSPISALLLVDTGAATDLRLTKRFTQANKLLPTPDKLTSVPECGLGGYAKEEAWQGTLEGVQLGRHKVSMPVTVFSEQSIPEDYDGFLGSGVLSRFKVIFDYSHGRMILESPVRRTGQKLDQ
jgi:Aspartyl protease